MANYVLVAGNLPTEIWNKITKRNDYPPGGHLGGKIWDYTAPVLKEKGHSIYTPDLKNEYGYSLSDQIEVVSKLIVENDLKNIILVGASYCGMVITGLANLIPERIDLLVYLDAVLPNPGQSVKEIFAHTHFIHTMPVENSPTFTEKLEFDPEKIKKIRKLYILCTQGTFDRVSSDAKTKINNDKSNWDYMEIPTSHLPMITHPDILNELLLDLSHKR